MSEWETTTTVGEVRSFLGLAGYYRRFVENFSRIAKPMTERLKNEISFNWTSRSEKAFETLKGKLSSAPVLTLPREGIELVICTDASKHGLG